MTVTLRSTSTLTNSVATTTHTVTKPTGTIDGDLLIAVVGQQFVATITPPAGWTLISSTTVGADTRLSAYYRIAAAEGASWAWTTGASCKSWAWVRSYTGADPSAPIAASKADAGLSLVAPYVDVPAYGQGLAIVCAAHNNASAQTWTQSAGEIVSGTEGPELSSTGVGGNTSGCTVSVDNAATAALPLTGTFEYGVGFGSFSSCVLSIALAPLVVAYDPAQPVPLVVEMAFGADPDDDSTSGWTWVDVTDRVRENPGVTITKGRQDEASQPTPTRMTLTLENDNGDFTPENPDSAYSPDIRRNTPLRVTVPGLGYGDSQRGMTFIDSWSPRWDTSTNSAVVEVSASGRTRRLQARSEESRSALYRVTTGSAITAVPAAYWPMEDSSGSTSFAAAHNGSAMLNGGGATFANDSSLLGSQPLPTLAADSTLSGIVPAHGSTSSWQAQAFVYIPSPISANVTLLTVLSAGQIRRWDLILIASGTDILRLEGRDIGGTVVYTQSVNVVESLFYGTWAFVYIYVDWDFGSPGAGAGWYSRYADDHTSYAAFTGPYGQPQKVIVPPSAQLTGASMGHIAVNVSGSFDDEPYLNVMFGGSGETPVQRFGRLADEQGISRVVVDADESTELRMGPQRVGTFLDTLDEITTLDRGVIYDGEEDGRLGFLTRSSRYNAPPSFELDMAAGEIAPGLEPQYDDQRIRNDITVTRTGGSSARYIGDISEGRYQDSVTVNLEDDDDTLYELATWIARTGSVTGMRYPRLALDFRRSPHLVPTWLSSRGIGARVWATNLPTQHGPNDIDVFVEGYTERLSTWVWRVEANCSPAAPYDVAIVEADDLEATFRLQTEDSQLALPVTSVATTLLVESDDALWDTTTLPYDIDVGGERATVTAVAPSISEPFTYVTANGWGTASGYSWVNFGAGGVYSNANFAANGTQGTHSLPAAGAFRGNYLSGGSWDDVDLQVSSGLSVVPTGGDIEIGNLLARFVDANNYYMFRVAVATDRSLTVSIRKLIGGAETVITTAEVNGLNHTAGNQWTTRARVESDRLSMKVWRTGTTEPYGWDVTTTDSTYTAGSIGVRSGAALANSNAKPVSVTFDNFLLLSPQTMTVTRSVNGVVKSHLGGTSVSLWRPRVTAL